MGCGLVQVLVGFVVCHCSGYLLFVVFGFGLVGLVCLVLIGCCCVLVVLDCGFGVVRCLVGLFGGLF